MTAVDSPPGGLRDRVNATFAPRTVAPSTATVLRSVLWPIAILAVIHRTIVVTTNGNITDDFKPVYRAVLNFRRGWDIYNEHFDYVDPHYLYPPGGTLLMAPFGYLPFAESRYLFIAINSAAIVLAGLSAAEDVQVLAHLSRGPGPAAGDVLHRIRHQHTGFHQHQRRHPAARGAVLALAARRPGKPGSGGPASPSD